MIAARGPQGWQHRPDPPRHLRRRRNGRRDRRRRRHRPGSRRAYRPTPRPERARAPMFLRRRHRQQRVWDEARPQCGQRRPTARSSGRLRGHAHASAPKHHLTRLHVAGCCILWLARCRSTRIYRHATVLTVDDPARVSGSSAPQHCWPFPVRVSKPHAPTWTPRSDAGGRSGLPSLETRPTPVPIV